MYCRSRPQYRVDLGWILGVAFLGTLTRPTRPAQGFTFIRCCSTPKASSPHGLATMQLPSACGCYQLAPQRTFTSYPGTMPDTPRPSPAGGREDAASLDSPSAQRLRHLAVGTEECSQRGSNKRMLPKRAKKTGISNRWFSAIFRPLLTARRLLSEIFGLVGITAADLMAFVAAKAPTAA
jgi:hypothetical protein